MHSCNGFAERLLELHLPERERERERETRPLLLKTILERLLYKELSDFPEDKETVSFINDYIKLEVLVLVPVLRI